MNSNSKKGTIFIAQVDHLSGECIGQAIELFYNRGASNVQVIPTITKKNRPSYIFFIDCREQYKDTIEETIFKELNTGGLHIIETIHKYL
ncbi:nickel insertion protein, partial [Intestinibacter sp.]|uniref:nickel insertion protein n=1 Tax=Intestinibacter sp. TaxID=1965304 RepID=UPI003F17E9C1